MTGDTPASQRRETRRDRGRRWVTAARATVAAVTDHGLTADQAYLAAVSEAFDDHTAETTLNTVDKQQRS